MSDVRKRLHRLYAEFPWNLYQRLGVHNMFLNSRAKPLPMDEVPSFPDVARGLVNVTSNEYGRLVELPQLDRFRPKDVVVCKALEYAVSLKLLDIQKGEVHLDAASGYGEYASAALELTSPKTLYCLDNVGYASQLEQDGRLVRLLGDVNRIPLPDNSVDTVSCHHSIEHFKNDADIGFVRELGRILRPGGRACIVPLFLASQYFEVWNTLRRQCFDPQARTLYDPFATFPGWGPCERFARVYDPAAFHRRVVQSALPLRATLFGVHYDGEVAPDMRNNRGQAMINGNLKALLLVKE